MSLCICVYVVNVRLCVCIYVHEYVHYKYGSM